MFEAILPFMPAIIGVALTGLTILLGWIKAKGWLNAQFLDQLNVDVSAAVTDTYNVYVRERKAANSDGKLTLEEKEEARNKALNTLKEIGKSKGKDYAKEWLVPVALDLVEKWVSRKKNSDGDASAAAGD